MCKQIYKAEETLGISWIETHVDTGDGEEHPLCLVDLEELKTDIENWRGRPIKGDKEAEKDWEAFCQAVKDAPYVHQWGMNLLPDRHIAIPGG